VVWRKHLNSTGIELPNDSSPESIADVDYAVWRQNFGASGGGESATGPIRTSVPEPAIGTLLLFALCFRARCYRVVSSKHLLISALQMGPFYDSREHGAGSREQEFWLPAPCSPPHAYWSAAHFPRSHH
jgi:hypothetical protein